MIWHTESAPRIGTPTRFHTQREIAEVTIWWRPLPFAVEMQGHLAHVFGRQPWELRTNGE
jgi:cytochrome bd-type quinol oxidase subunit 1